MQLTNKQLVYIISIALIITLFGTAVNLARLGIVPGIPGITGLPTVGNVSITISTQASFNMTNNNISFGPGVVTAGQANAVLDTKQGSVTNGNWTAVTLGFILENTGNVDLNITVESAGSNSTAASLIGGTNPQYNYTTTEDNAATCDSTGGTLAVNLRVEFNTTVTQNQTTVLCSNFSYRDANDQLEVDVNLTIPLDSTTGYRQDIWIFRALQR